jgi:hypothetical protein
VRGALFTVKTKPHAPPTGVNALPPQRIGMVKVLLVPRSAVRFMVERS